MPPIVSLAQGSLGFMCNFTFEDHPQVIGPILRRANRSIESSVELGLEKRMRLKVDVGPGESP